LGFAGVGSPDKNAKKKQERTRDDVGPKPHPRQVHRVLVRRVDRVAQLLAVVNPHADLVDEAVRGVALARRVLRQQPRRRGRPRARAHHGHAVAREGARQLGVAQHVPVGARGHGGALRHAAIPDEEVGAALGALDGLLFCFFAFVVLLELLSVRGGLGFVGSGEGSRRFCWVRKL